MPIKRNLTRYNDDLADGRYWGNSLFLPNPPTSVSDFSSIGYSDLVESKGHPYWQQLWKIRENSGGPFEVRHRRIVEQKVLPVTYYSNMNTSGGGRTKRYLGPITAQAGSLVPDSTRWPDALSSSDSELNAFGTTAIALVEPTNPLSGLTVALGELRREGLPSLPGTLILKGKIPKARRVGGEYLNKEFGWDPLISDLKKLAHVVDNYHKLVVQYEQGSGRKRHRRYETPTVKTTTLSESGTGGGYLYPGLPADFWVIPPKWSRTLTVEKTRWFEGCFTYYLPPYVSEGSNWERNRRIAHKLFGADFTPETIWALTPWSWAFDWVSNAGEVIHNIGAFRDNGLVMLYGYVMETTVHRQEIRVWDIRSRESEYLGGDGSPRNTSCSMTIETIVKKRRSATPYGFGLDWAGFTPFQLSIVAALGLSKRG